LAAPPPPPRPRPADPLAPTPQALLADLAHDDLSAGARGHLGDARAHEPAADHPHCLEHPPHPLAPLSPAGGGRQGARLAGTAYVTTALTSGGLAGTPVPIR